jgi:hypothetical protein
MFAFSLGFIARAKKRVLDVSIDGPSVERSEAFDGN